MAEVVKSIDNKKEKVGFFRTLKDILGILIIPKRVIENGIKGKSAILVILMMFLGSSTNAVHKIVNQITYTSITKRSGPIGPINWEFFWYLFVVYSLFYAIPKYFLGGTLFNIALEWAQESDERNQDKKSRKHGRHIYIFSYIIPFMATVIVYGGMTLSFDMFNYKMEPIIYLVFVPYLAQLIRTGFCYMYVRHNFKCSRKLLNILFLIVPFIWYFIEMFCLCRFLELT